MKWLAFALVFAACDANGVTGTVHACPSSAESIATVDGVMTEDPSITGFFVHNEGALPHVAATIRSPMTRCSVG